MKYIFLIFVILLNLPVYSANSKKYKRKDLENLNLLKNSCKKEGGKLVKELICPQSEEKRSGLFCVVKESFYNGCTSSVAGYGSIFFKACKVHDNCYHHEPATNGKTKEICDNEFLENMYEICQERTDLSACRFFAKSFYKAVDFFGDKSFKCSNSYSNYSEVMSY